MNRIVFLVFILFCFGLSQAQVGINNSSPDDNAVLDLKSKTKGLLIPRMTTTLRETMSTSGFAQGMMVYDTDLNVVFVGYGVGTTLKKEWYALNPWKTVYKVNSNTFSGQASNANISFMQGKVGIGTASPTVKLDVKGNARVNGTFAVKEDATINGTLAVKEDATINGITVGLGKGDIYGNNYQNTALGYQALYINSKGNGNTASGYEALTKNTTGSYNTASGFRALTNNTKGSYNTASGTQALEQNTTAKDNTATGYAALEKNTTGDNNTASGTASLANNTEGKHNTAIGAYALWRNTKGNYNTASGEAALEKNTTGGNNTALGQDALNSNTTGSHNTALGRNAGYSGNHSNTTTIGYNAAKTASDQVRIGNSSVTSIGGYRYWTNVSDARFKKNIEEKVIGLDFIMALRPVTYNLDMDAIASFNETPDSLRLEESERKAGEILETGFIAQEVELAARELGYDFSGVDAPKNDKDNYGLRYSAFVVPLVKAMQEQQALIQSQQATNEKHQALIKKLEERITTLEKR